MTDLSNTLTFQESKVRFALISGKPMLAAADICKATGKKMQACYTSNVDDSEKFKTNFGVKNTRITLLSPVGVLEMLKHIHNQKSNELSAWVQNTVIPKFKDLKENQESENVKSDSAISVLGTYIEPKEYNCQRVVTFKDIDRVHQRPDGTASRNFRQNKEHFIEGEDFYKITPDEFRRTIGNMDARQQNDITLITETGYLMLVKSFTDSLSWKVQRQLVNVYFKVKQMVQEKPQAQQNMKMQLPQDYPSALRALANEAESREKLQAQVKEDAPFTNVGKAVTNAEGSMLVRELAKVLNQNGFQTGEKRLFALLRADGFLIKKYGSDYNLPTQRSSSLGLMRIKETTHAFHGVDTVCRTPIITPIGQAFFINHYCRKQKGEQI